MSPINYQALQSGDTGALLPDDGGHVATLERAALVSTQNGERLVTEWQQTDGPASWTSWNRFDETGLSYTIALLDGLGADRSNMTDDASLQEALDALIGYAFEVKTASQMGSRGDRTFVTTYVNGRAQGVQQKLNGDVPIDDADLAPPGGSAASKVAADDDIPF